VAGVPVMSGCVIPVTRGRTWRGFVVLFVDGVIQLVSF
jgi:hypothetical protein